MVVLIRVEWVGVIVNGIIEDFGGKILIDMLGIVVRERIEEL